MSASTSSLAMLRRLPPSPGHLRSGVSHLARARSLPSYQWRRAASSSSRPPSSSASSKAASSRPVLEKPSRYAPPSHPSRARRGKLYQNQYGGELTPAMKAAQATKKYPHMMPPEGTFMYWFLTSRTVHAIITISVLSACAFTVFTLEFRRRTPFLDRVPSWSELGRHPIRSIQTLITVYRDHVDWTSQQTQLARDKDLEDARKRKAYRVAHGLERPEHGLQGNVAGVDVSFAEKADLQEEAAFEQKVKQAYREAIVKAGGNPEIMDAYKEQRGKPKELKKWFGIW